MNAIEAAVLAVLTEEPEPAQAIAAKVDGSPALNIVQYALRELIADKKAARHHNGDGILRYSRLAPAPAKAQATAKTPAPNVPVPVRGKSAQMLRHIGSTPISSSELQALSGLSGKEVSNLLTHLKAKGVITGSNGMGAPGAWVRVSGVEVSFEESHVVRQPPSKPKAPKQEPSAAPIASPVLAALVRARDAAAEAADAYIASVVDQDIHRTLCDVRDAVQRAVNVLGATP